MPEILPDGRRHWTAEEVEFLSDPENLKTKEQHEAARDMHVTRDINYLIDCILSDRDPCTGRSITEEERELLALEKW